MQHGYIYLVIDLRLSWHITDELARRRVVSGVLFHQMKPLLIVSKF